MKKLAPLFALSVVAAASSLLAQTTVTLNGTTGTNVTSSNLSTTGGLTLGLGFYLDVLAVGGGGGGGARFGGGGGAGGVLYQENVLVSALTNSVAVGAGGGGGSATGGSGTFGATSGTNGQNSSFANLIAYGGGGGGAGDQINGFAGGSGGGGSGRFATSGGAGTNSQGNAGGGAGNQDKPFRGAGGGGAGAAGAIGGSGSGAGGSGRSISITGSAVTYGGGGGGGGSIAHMDFGNAAGGPGGSGGGGAGGNWNNSSPAQAGAANTGGGGGGSAYAGSGTETFNAASGGSGIVIVRYQGSPVATGGTVTSGTGSASGYTLHTYASTGTNYSLAFSAAEMNARLGATLTGVISGTGNMVYNGPGKLTLGGNNTYTGATVVAAGELNVNGSIAGSAVSVSSGASLSGSGTVGAISGTGAINPGNSPGILTAPSVDPAGGLSFNFEFTGLNPVFSAATASVNDLLRLTAGAPFTAALSSANTVNVYFNTGAFAAGQVYTGAFFTDAQGDFLNQIIGANFNYYVASESGGIEYNGVNYEALDESLRIALGTTAQNSADFAGGTIDGRIAQFEVIPEPGTNALLVLAAAGLGVHVWRKRRRA